MEYERQSILQNAEHAAVKLSGRKTIAERFMNPSKPHFFFPEKLTTECGFRDTEVTQSGFERHYISLERALVRGWISNNPYAKADVMLNDFTLSAVAQLNLFDDV